MGFTLRFLTLLLSSTLTTLCFGQEFKDGVSGIFAPGSSLTIRVTGSKSSSVGLHALGDSAKQFDSIPATTTTEGLQITLPATKNIGPGYYYFTLPGDGNLVVPGAIDIEGEKIKLVSVHPATAYRGKTDKFDFDLVGENFSPNVANDDVTIDGQGSIVKERDPSNKCKALVETCLWVENDRLMHVVAYSPKPYQGVVNVGIRVGNVVPTDRQPLVLARYSGTAVFLLSAAVTAILFWIVSTVVRTGLSKNKIGKKALNLYQSFILDPETNSYSLSKFQLLVFSGTFIFGYLYVLLSRWLVQWQFVLPDVPSTIAGLLGISGGTTVAAAGLTAARGAKGGGLQHPTGADLISSGGVVIPERFQFFVWTIVACGGFIALLIGQDPAKVNTFPELPAGLLYVMGVSAAGYLGGKAARKPGPVLENVGVEKPTAGQPANGQPAEGKPWPTLLVQGQNLSSDGRFFVDEKELGFPSDEDKQKFQNLPPKLVTGIPQTGGSDTNFCTRLEIIILDSSVELKQGDHVFRIVNRDGQFADISFSRTPTTISAVYDEGNPPPADDPNPKKILASEKEVPVVIKGVGLVTGSTVEWRPPGGITFEKQTEVPGAPNDGTELWVSLVPGLRVDLPGAINVTTPKGFVGSATVSVVKPVPPAQPSVLPQGGAPKGQTGQIPAPGSQTETKTAKTAQDSETVSKADVEAADVEAAETSVPPAETSKATDPPKDKDPGSPSPAPAAGPQA